MTSLRGTDVGDKFSNDVKLRRAYLPIYPARNQDTETQLHLENGAELRKKSYANTREQHTVPFHILRPYDRHVTTQYVLTSDSYRKLARHAGFALPITSPFEVESTAIRTTGALPTTLTRDERLRLAPGTYGTIPISRAATPAHYSGASGAAEWDGTRALAKLVLLSVLFGITVWGLLSAWAHRAEFWNGLPGGVSWVGAHALWLMKGAVGGLLRAVIWLVARIAEIGKIGALKVWEWVRGRLWGLMF